MNAIGQIYTSCPGFAVLASALLILLFCGAATLCGAWLCQSAPASDNSCPSEEEAQAGAALSMYCVPPTL